MVSYKSYKNENFNTADDPVIIDLITDIGPERHPVEVSCDEGKIDIQFEFNEAEGFGEKITYTSCDDVMQRFNVRRVRLTSLQDNSSYRVIGGMQ